MEFEYFECFIECGIGDMECEADCLRDFHENLKKCPCQELCLDGCPCDQYDCSVAETTTVSTTTTVASTTTKAETTRTQPSDDLAILAINSYRDEKSAIVALDGRINEQPYFSFNDYTDAYEACSVQYKGEMIVLGGSDQQTQISKVINCKLTRTASLPFNLNRGGCSVFGDDELMLCFDYANAKTCWRFISVYE